MIENIFPTQIYIDNIKIEDLDNNKFLDFCKKTDFYTTNAGFNSNASINQNLLENDLFKKLKLNILSCAKKYLKNMGHIFEDLQFSNSWATKTEPKGFSQFHCHKNSYISGTYYMEKSSMLSLENFYIKQWFFSPLIKFDEKNNNTFKCINFKPEAKSIILFPSFLDHRVMPNKSNKNRYSIAFNIIPKGEFGDETMKLYL